MIKNTCLYFHINPIKQEIFYVGIGIFSRPYSKNGRTKRWCRIVKKYGYDVVIIHKNLTLEEACELEIKYIKQIGRFDLHEGALINFTNGGDELPNTNGKLNGRAKKYVFVDPFKKTYYVHGEFKKFCIENGLISNSMSRLLVGKTIKKHYKGWQVFYEEFFNEGLLHINHIENDINEHYTKASKEALIKTRKGKNLSKEHKDKISKNNGKSKRKISDEQIIAVRKMLEKEIRNIDISRILDLSPSIICNIKKGNTWKNQEK